jgi:hypothetical protein
VDVVVTHPAYVRHMPRNARNMRETLARTETPATLATARRGDLEPLGVVTVEARNSSFVQQDRRKRNPFELVSHGGATYVPLTYVDAYAGPTEMSVEGFVDYLVGNASGSRLDGCVDAFNGTPLQDMSGYASLHGAPEDGRGAPYDPERQREVALDGREAAAARLRAFLAEEILLGPGRVYRRFRPLAQRVDHAPEWRVPDLRRGNPLQGTVAVAIDRLDDAAILDRSGHPVPDPAREEAARLIALDPSLAGRDDDVEIGVAQIACVSARWLHGTIRDKEGDAGEMRALAEAFAPCHMLLRTGALPQDEWPEAQRMVRRVVGAMRAVGEPKGTFLDHLTRADRYLDRIAAPRLQARTPVAAEDVAALGALSP